MRRLLFLFLISYAALPVAHAEPRHTQSQWADISTRQAAMDWYQAQYVDVADLYDMGWTGSYDSCSPGAISIDYQQRTIRRINYFRQVAGLSPITLDHTHDIEAQHAAYMMSINQQLNHAPPSTWECWTQEGSNGAGHSNLAINLGWQAIDAYMRDPGNANADVNHRRWMLHPQTQKMTTGQVPGTTGKAPMNAVWVWDEFLRDVRPATRDICVAWPPAGFVPYDVVYPRWSCQIANADFSVAQVRMTKDGQPISVVLEPVFSNGTNESALVWRPEGIAHNVLWPRPDHDTIYGVTISNYTVNGIQQTVQYTTTIFAPNDPPTQMNSTLFPPPETAPIGTIVATVAVQDDDGPYDYTLSLEGADAGTFSINGMNISSANTFDYEIQPQYTLTVRATNSLSQTITKTLIVDVQNIPETPALIQAHGVLQEQTTPQSITLAISDQDSTSHTVVFASGTGDIDNADFTLVGTTLWIDHVDYEQQQTYSVRLRATDSDGLWIEQSVIIVVQNLNEPPLWIDSVGNSVSLIISQTQTFTVTAQDPEGFVGDIHLVSLEPPTAWITITGQYTNGLGLIIITALPPREEVGISHTLTIEASDFSGHAVLRTIQIDVVPYRYWVPVLLH